MTRSRWTRRHAGSTTGCPGGDPMSDTHEAQWLLSTMGRFEVGPAPLPTAGPGEVVLKVRAVAMNPVDAITGPLRRIVTPWGRYPTVIGSDVAGEVVEIGREVTRLRPGDRVLGYAAGQERARNTPAEGGFQRYVVVLARVCTPIPDHVAFENAAVVPLGLSTAAAGLFEPDQISLLYPGPAAEPRHDVVLVWGASTSVGCNAVELARASGYTVLATAGTTNHEYVRSLGAEAVFDYRQPDVDDKVLTTLGDRPLAGTMAIGQGSLTHALRIARRSTGTKRIASAYPDPVTKAPGADRADTGTARQQHLGRHPSPFSHRASHLPGLPPCGTGGRAVPSRTGPDGHRPRATCRAPRARHPPGRCVRNQDRRHPRLTPTQPTQTR